MSLEFNNPGFGKLLENRATMLHLVRSFFFQKKVLEVDPPSISKNPSIDAYIEVMQTTVLDNEIGYLHTSPEYAMKRLLAQNSPDIYFLGHVFRKNEIGSYHNPEFTMIEWYRRNVTFDFFISEVIELIFLFLPKVPVEKLTYREVFLKFLDLDYTKASADDFLKIAKKNNLSLSNDLKSLDADGFLNLFMSSLIEPKLNDKLYIIYDYPKTQAALAKTVIKDGIEVASRFEFYYQGMELANGFHELSDEKIQRQRLIEANQKRKEKLPLDEKFLASIKQGIGDTFGIAAGFDRLLMLKYNKKSINEVLPFGWQET